ncbi:hypothetical protein PMAC_001874 [Pneumocystis sp. 'macacae']|nr:hypothetical protein PMAC_001874 [Pneumocystis sp. 'macacae']
MVNNEMFAEVVEESEVSTVKDVQSKISDNEIDKKELLETKQQDKDNIEYSVGDLVLAKISGYPWWPGMIFPEDAVPKDVKDARPASRRRRNGTEIKYWLVRFFPTPEYIWATKSDIRPLTSKMIDDFLSKKTTKKDIRESYEIAKTFPTVEDLLAQQSFGAKDEVLEEEEEEEDRVEDDEEFNDDDSNDLKNGDIDDIKKNVLKRKSDFKKAENKKKKFEDSSHKVKTNDQGKKLSTKSRKALNKISNGDSSEEYSVYSEQSSQIKWEQKKQQVLFLRHKLQRIMLTTGKAPSEADMPIVSEQLEKLETFKGIDVAILRTTKIGKVLKRIVQLSDIPANEKYSIKERSEKLLVFWKDLLEKPNDDIENNQEKKSKSSSKKDRFELHTINGNA